MNQQSTKIFDFSLGALIGSVIFTIFTILLFFSLRNNSDLLSFPTLLVLIILCLLGLLIFITYPLLGIYFIMFASLIDQGIFHIAGYGVFIVQPIIICETIALFFRWIFLKKERLAFPYEILPLFFLLSVYVLSLINSIDAENSIGGILYFIVTIIICWIFLQYSINFLQINRLWLFVFSISLLVGFFSIVQYIAILLGINLSLSEYSATWLIDYHRPSGIFSEPNWLGIYAGTCLSFVLPFWLYKFQNITKIISTKSLLVLVITVLISGTRSVWIGLIFSFIIYFLLHNPNTLPYNKKIIYLPFLFCLVLIFGLFSEGMLERISSTFNYVDRTATTRINTWQFAWELIKTRPWTGYGVASWEILSLSQPINSSIEMITGGKSVSNILLADQLDAGIPGLVAFLTLFGYIFINSIKMIHNKDNIYASIYGRGIFLGITTIFISSIFTSGYKYYWFWIFIALSLTTICYYRKNKRVSQN